MKLNEARKLAGLPQVLTESSMVILRRYEDSLMKLQKAFTTDSNLFKSLEKDGIAELQKPFAMKSDD